MDNLSSVVLSKIQNLISQIDKPSKAKRQQKERAEGIENEPNGSQISNQMSYSNLNHKHKVLTKKVNEAYQQQKPQSYFKIVNKRTQSIINKKNPPPIYERVEQILAIKKMKINMLQQSLMEKQQASMKPQIHTDKQDHKYSKTMREQDIESFRQSYEQKNRRRIEKKHIKQLSKFDKEVIIPQPSVGNLSKSLSKKHNLKKKYSQDVFLRLDQDRLDRNHRMEYLKSKRRQEQGGFQPIICSKSKSILEQRFKHKNSITKMDDSSYHNKCKSPPKFIPVKRKSTSSFKSSNSPFNNTISERRKVSKISKSPNDHKNKNQKMIKSLRNKNNINSKSQNIIKKQKSKIKNTPLQLDAQCEKQSQKRKQSTEKKLSSSHLIRPQKRTTEGSKIKEKGKNKPIVVDYVQLSPIDYHKCRFHDHNRKSSYHKNQIHKNRTCSQLYM